MKLWDNDESTQEGINCLESFKKSAMNENIENTVMV